MCNFGRLKKTKPMTLTLISVSVSMLTIPMSLLFCVMDIVDQVYMHMHSLSTWVIKYNLNHMTVSMLMMLIMLVRLLLMMIRRDHYPNLLDLLNPKPVQDFLVERDCFPNALISGLSLGPVQVVSSHSVANLDAAENP